MNGWDANGKAYFEPNYDLRFYADALSFELPVRQAPTDVFASTLPVIIMSPDRQRFEAVWAHWGLVPRWHDGALKDWDSNRAWTPVEDVTAQKSAQTPWVRRHCLIPILSYALSSFDGKHLLHARHKSGGPMAAAGLCSQHHQEGRPISSFTILTRPTRHSIAATTDQEPILLGEDNWWAWLVHQSVAELQQSRAYDETHLFHLSDRHSRFRTARRRA